MSFIPHQKNNRFNHAVAIVILLLFFQPFHLTAQNNIPDTLVRERIQNIQNILEHGRKYTNVWWYGWLYGYSAATVLQGTLYFASDNMPTKQNMALGVVTDVLGVAGQLITPIHPGHKADILSGIPDSTYEQRLTKLDYAERSLKQVAANERFGRSWKLHTLYGTVNLGCGLITWLAFKHSLTGGIVCFVLNSVVSEAQIWSQPIRTRREYENYCNKYKSGKMPLAFKSSPSFHINAYPGGVCFRMSF
jgi:hypothetical protein